MDAKRLIVRVTVVAALAAVGYGLVTAKMPGKTLPGRTKVVFWHRWGGYWEKIVDKIVDRFNQSQTEYEVVPLFVPSSGSETKFMLSTIGGDPPDVMSMGSDSIPSIAVGGLLTDLETLMTPEEREYFHRVPYPGVRECGQFRGKTYGITIGADLMAYYVNADELRAVGADPDKPPKTFEELVELGKKLTKKDEKGNIIRMGFSTGDLMTQSIAWGGGFYDAKTDKLTMDTPENEAALTALVEQRKTVGYENAQRFWSSQNTGSSTGAWSFIPGAVAITYDGQWRVDEIHRAKPDMDYRIWPLIPPAGGKPYAGLLGGNYMIIPTSAKQKKGAFEFVKFWSGLTHPERAAEFYKWGGWVPLSPDVAKAPIYQEFLKDNPQFKTFIDILSGPNCHSKPPIGYLQYYMDQISRVEDQALRGSVTPKQALQQLQTTVDNELRKRKELGFDD
ncbi:MAG: extracellular solute-binding protein [Armatimonadetes bacterium]|nr:extracellular solute-binding protein [Armatimonadota bacterium]MBS1725981.1 ABC transporter substrate-binding protein [Armatimonadota bacterium]